MPLAPSSDDSADEEKAVQSWVPPDVLSVRNLCRESWGKDCANWEIFVLLVYSKNFLKD